MKYFQRIIRIEHVSGQKDWYFAGSLGRISKSNSVILHLECGHKIQMKPSNAKRGYKNAYCGFCQDENEP